MQIVGTWIIKRQPAEYDLIINVPPGTTKSTIGSVMLHVWLWINAPWIRIISGSYAQDLSLDHSLKARQVLKSEKFRELFPHKVIFSSDRDNKTDYMNIKGGQRLVTSVGTSPIGRHAHLISLDDLIDPNGVASDIEREKTNKWLGSVSMRKIDKLNTPTILLMQRLHELDPTGFLLDKAENEGKRIKHICLPGTLDLNNVMPKKLRMLYKDGLLDPHRLSKRALKSVKIDLGASEYAGQVNQSPEPPGGNIIKTEWIKPFTELPKARILSKVQSWDTAFKKTDTSAWNVCTDWYEFEHGFYLDNVFCEKLEYPELKKAVVSSDAEFKPDFTLVEDKATGTPAMQELSIDTRINFVPITPEIDKVQRAHAVSPTFEAGNVYIRMNASWSRMVIQQLTMFPNCKIKDIMDSVSQYITYIRQHGTYNINQLHGSGESDTTRGY